MTNETTRPVRLGVYGEPGAARSISAIARETYKTWTNVHYAAAPYLAAMLHLDAPRDRYGEDSAKSVVTYFLTNATTWRGDDARRIKAELKRMIK